MKKDSKRFEIIQYYFKHGEHETLKNWNIKPSTLERYMRMYKSSDNLIADNSPVGNTQPNTEKQTKLFIDPAVYTEGPLKLPNKEVNTQSLKNSDDVEEITPMTVELKKKERLLLQLGEKLSIEELNAINKGYNPSLITAAPSKCKVTTNAKTIKVGVMSDTHIGSKWFIESWWDDALATFKDQNVEFICHVGDLTEGLTERKGHWQELTHIGYGPQKKYAVELLNRTDIPIYGIDGNHDRWYAKSVNALICQDIAELVPHYHFLGCDEGDIYLNDNVNIKLWHGEDGSCFDENTEILTKEHGFIPFNELTLDMNVATMTKENHIFEWQKPTEITNQHYSGDMYNFKARCVDLNVTPNHRFWTKYNHSINQKKLDKSELKYPTKSHPIYSDNWEALTAEYMYDNFRKQKYILPRTVNGFKKENDTIEYIDVPYLEPKNIGMKDRMNHVGRIRIDTAAKLIAWYVTEGHARKNTVTLSQYVNINPENHKEIQELAAELNINYTVNPKFITLHSKELSEWIRNTCGHLSRHKYLPDFIKNADERILRIVFDTMINGDGWKRNGKANGYRSISKKLIDDFSLIAVKLGYAISYSKDGEAVSISDVQVTPAIVKKPTKYHYDGQIYCCSVPNELIFVRKNGRCIWSHNSYATSYRVQKVIESFTGGEKPNILLLGHTHKSLYLPMERNVFAFSSGALCKQSAWMRSKKLPNHSGYWVITITYDENSVISCGGEFFAKYSEKEKASFIYE